MEQSLKAKVWLDECTSEEVKAMWDEAQDLSLEGLRHPDTGAVMSVDEARELIKRFDMEAQAKSARQVAGIKSEKERIKTKNRCRNKRVKQSRRANRK